jgi:ABC-2 type transport system ATP-binding protein
MSQPTHETVLQLRHLVKAFGAKSVLTGADLTIRRGSVVGLLGRNGAGKTTLLKCALGLLKPAAGAAAVFGEDAWDLSAQSKARIGYVPQEPNIYPWMTVRQVIDYTAAFYPNWNHELIERLAARQQVPMGQRVGPLSVGQLQTLTILLALGHEPELLILDEPVASLDPAARRGFLQTLLEIVADGSRTILFSTHITSDLERVASEVALLRDGRIALHSDLGMLKDRVKRLRITAEHALPADLAIPDTLRIDRNGTSAVVTVQNFTDQLPAALRDRWNVEVDVQDLNLEEIFLELHGDVANGEHAERAWKSER